MLFIINFKILRAINNRVDNLKDKQRTKKSGHFCQKYLLWIFAFNLLIYVQKNFILISIVFLVIVLKRYIDILKEYRKRAITRQKTFFFLNLRKQFLDIHIRNVMPKFESTRLNGVAVIAKTHTPTYIHTYWPT